MVGVAAGVGVETAAAVAGVAVSLASGLGPSSGPSPHAAMAAAINSIATTTYHLFDTLTTLTSEAQRASLHMYSLAIHTATWDLPRSSFL